MKTVKIKGPIVSNDTAIFYDWIGWDCCNPGKVETALNEANGEDVTLEINSPGGTCVSGFEIYNLLRGYSGKVTAHVSYACSAATMIACAADQVLMSEAGIYMIHNTQGRADGDYRDMDEEGDALRQLNDSLLNVYEKKTGMSREEIQKLMDESTYMGPQRAMEYKFVDGLLPDTRGKENLIQTAVAAEVPIVPEDIAKEVMAMFKNREVAPVQQSNAEEPQEEKGERIMTLEEFKAQSVDASEELKAVIENAKNEAVKEERSRLEKLDDLKGVVSEEDLREAKYGEHPIDAPTLAYQSALKNKELAGTYQKNAMDDAKNSGAGEVGNGKPDVGEEPENEDEKMAGYINQMRGGRK